MVSGVPEQWNDMGCAPAVVYPRSGMILGVHKQWNGIRFSTPVVVYPSSGMVSGVSQQFWVYSSSGMVSDICKPVCMFVFEATCWR